MTDGEAESHFGTAQASASRSRSVAKSTRPQSTTDRVHVPADAGRYRDSLLTVLLRMPHGWIREISCGPGWYPLVAQVNLKLCELDVHHQVLQVKEKFGTLRYYAESHTDDELKYRDFCAVTSDAERLSTTICEQCGNGGRLCVSSHGVRMKTLCRECERSAPGGAFTALDAREISRGSDS